MPRLRATINIKEMGSIEEETCRADAIEACEVASDARSVQAETEIDSILEVRKGWEASALGRYTSSPWTLNFFLFYRLD